MMLKPIIKSIVTQFMGSDPSFSLTSGKVSSSPVLLFILANWELQANMRMLQHWYKTQGCSNVERSTDRMYNPLLIPPLWRRLKFYHPSEANDDTIEHPLVVLVEDFEAFPGDLLKELISIFG